MLRRFSALRLPGLRCRNRTSVCTHVSSRQKRNLIDRVLQGLSPVHAPSDANPKHLSDASVAGSPHHALSGRDTHPPYTVTPKQDYTVHVLPPKRTPLTKYHLSTPCVRGSPQEYSSVNLCCCYADEANAPLAVGYHLCLLQLADRCLQVSHFFLLDTHLLRTHRFTPGGPFVPGCVARRPDLRVKLGGRQPDQHNISRQTQRERKRVP